MLSVGLSEQNAEYPDMPSFRALSVGRLKAQNRQLIFT
jgi:hypothetical protein